MTEAEVEKLRSAGIDDAVILGLQKDEAVKNGQAAPVVQSKSALPEVDPNTPSTVFEQAQAAGVPTAGREQTWGQTAVELGALVAPYAVPAAIAVGTGALGVGAYKFGSKALDVGRGISDQMAQRNAIETAREARLANRPGFGGPAPAAAPPAPAVAAAPRPMPTAAPAYMPPPAPAAPAYMPPPAPAAPAYMPPPAPAAPAPSVIQRGTDIANQMRQYAAQRVIPAVSQAGQMVGRGLTAAAPALRVGGMASNALYSGGLNTDEQAELERRRKMAPTISR